MNKKYRQLVLIIARVISKDGTETNKTGTGYLITKNLVLTANHVYPDSDNVTIRVRLHSGGKWIDADSTPYWENIELDALLIRIKEDVEIDSVIWQEESFPDDQEWDSIGYPDAAIIHAEDQLSYTSKGLKGTLYAEGGGGQTSIKKLDLSVEAPPTPPDKWKGVSGAPVFVGEKLAGILRSLPAHFNDRLEGIPSYELLKDPGFKAAIEEDRFSIPTGTNWALLLIGEGTESRDIEDPARSALSEYYDKNFKTVVINITEVLSNPGNLLNFIKLICSAPVMIIDATHFQPGIMMIMGIRAVARRGVTIVTTTLAIPKEEISNLPFNIQEIKLVSLVAQQRERGSAKDKLKRAIAEGMDRYRKSPAYLDLPPYDAVRNPVIFDEPGIKEKFLILCPFKAEYEQAFIFLWDKLTLITETPKIVRMLDISSPQLVGQSLYEHIRWCRFCMIDWTGWRANVFYEFGIRLASSDMPPLNIIDSSEDNNIKLSHDQASAVGAQQQMLRALFQPFSYTINDATRKAGALFTDRIKEHMDYVEGGRRSAIAQPVLSAVYYDNIYETIEQHFDWKQASISNMPHINIKNQLEREFGSDREAAGKYNVLYSHNKGFKDAIQNQIRENWIAAWYYFLNRYSIAEFEKDEVKKKELIAIGYSTLLVLKGQADYKRIYEDIVKIIDQLEE
jgi:hypothetical protein